MTEDRMYPQSNFRYVKRNGERILQMQYLGIRNKTVVEEWVDVPTVEVEK